MKPFIYSFLVSLALFGCNQTPKTADNQSDSTTMIPKSDDAMEQHCYEAQVGKDSASMKINNLDGKITGQLAFNFYEKDDSHGDIKGEFKGDTLFVDYTFTAEGNILSKNPLVFLKQGDDLVQGYGEIENYLGKTYFKDHSKLKFENGFTFKPGDCE